ncbi:hypothetical protein B0O79_1817 [Flavobacteriaceae bacterium MAR_2009_75]|nr:hypothetical protein B0O79_1817 [Flavobacteriaceae bacterium MAR_2009_75]
MATTKNAKSGKIRSPLRKLRISIKVILEDNVWDVGLIISCAFYCRAYGL